MSREILFRGKRLDTGEWVYGDYGMNDDGEAFVIVCRAPCSSIFYKVDPATVGQFTGMYYLDGGGLVYGGDRLQSEEGEIGIINYNDDKAAFTVCWENKDCQLNDVLSVHLKFGAKKLGTIHDKEVTDE